MNTEPGGPPPEPVDVTAAEPPPTVAKAPRGASHTVSIALTATALLVASSITASVVATRDDSGGGTVLVGDCVGPLQRGLIGPRGDQITAEPVRAVDCTAPDAAYRIALWGPGPYAICPDPAYRVRRVGVGTKDARTLCMTYNVDSDECFVEAPAEEAGPYDCGLGPRPNAIRVLRVVHGSADPKGCAGLNQRLLVVTVPRPATTFCYVMYGSAPDVKST